LINTGMAGAGAWGYVSLMDSDVAKADAVPIIGSAVGGEIVGQYIYDGFTLVGKFNEALSQLAWYK